MTEQTNKQSDVLKATVLLGGSSLITILIGMARTKISAVLLGPTGVGLIGVFSGLAMVVGNACGLGLHQSGIRHIAEASSKEDSKGLLQAISALSLFIWITAFFGLIVMFFGARFFSQISFETSTYEVWIMGLSLMVFFTIATNSRLSILQGLRRIREVAVVNIIGAACSFIIALPLFYFFKEKGIIPSLVLGALATLLISIIIGNMIDLPKPKILRTSVLSDFSPLFRLGFPLMLSSLVATAVNYIIRIFIIRSSSLADAGQYMAAISLSGVLVNFVLTAMSNDYFPRISSIAFDNSKINEEVNIQTEISILLALPALVVTFVFMPFLIRLFFSSQFVGAIEILKWMIIGVLGRVVSWPLSYIMIAKARGKLFMLSELLSGSFHVLAVIICFKIFGLEGLGLAFAILYIVYSIAMTFVASMIADTRWSNGNRHLVMLSSLILSFLLLLQQINIIPVAKWIVNIAVLIVITCYCLKKIETTTGKNITRIFKKRYI